MTPKNPDLHLSPPSKIVDDLLSVPINIQHVNAHLIFDMAVQKAKVEATVHFLSGIEKGNPVFDLRQDIKEASINDTIVSCVKIRHHDFGGGRNAELRVLQTMS